MARFVGFKPRSFSIHFALLNLTIRYLYSCFSACAHILFTQLAWWLASVFECICTVCFQICWFYCCCSCWMFQCANTHICFHFIRNAFVVAAAVILCLLDVNIGPLAHARIPINNRNLIYSRPCTSILFHFIIASQIKMPTCRMVCTKHKCMM